MMNSNHDHHEPLTDNSARKARIHDALTSCALFKAASATTLETALSAASLDAVPRGKPIVQQGSMAHALALLARGRARVERSLLSGDVLPLGYRGAGDVAGESALVGTENYTENVVAMDDSDVVRIPMSAMNAILRSDVAIAQALVTVMLQRQLESEERLTSLLFRPVEGRVAEFLLHAANRWGVQDARGTLISAPITHLEIAKTIGSTRETVTVTLGVLRRDGLLVAAGRRLIVVDRDALTKRK
jgi:CRP/FNR family transcriptional regulator, cyclic AMP receptor protein